MEEGNKLTYFFDSIDQVEEITNELCDRYLGSIERISFLRAHVEESLFVAKKPKNAMETLIASLQGEEDVENAPPQSTQHIVSVFLKDDAPHKEIDTCFWVNGGFKNDFDDKWYNSHVSERFHFVFEKDQMENLLKNFSTDYLNKLG